MTGRVKWPCISIINGPVGSLVKPPILPYFSVLNQTIKSFCPVVPKVDSINVTKRGYVHVI